MSVQQHASQGLIANEWAEHVAEAVGGKAGGKGSISVGSGTKLGKVEEGVQAAVEYLKKLEH